MQHPPQPSRLLILLVQPSRLFPSLVKHDFSAHQHSTTDKSGMKGWIKGREGRRTLGETIRPLVRPSRTRDIRLEHLRRRPFAFLDPLYYFLRCHPPTKHQYRLEVKVKGGGGGRTGGLQKVCVFRGGVRAGGGERCVALGAFGRDDGRVGGREGPPPHLFCFLSFRLVYGGLR